MRRFFIFIVLVFLATTNLIAQVHLQTGSAQFSHSLFNYSDESSGLNTSISIQYTSGGGLKVNDIAGDVGLGWALAAGGFIQRVQYGEPDDQDSRTLYPPIANCTNGGGFNHNIAYWDPVLIDMNGNTAVTPGARDYISNYYPNGYLFSEFPLSENLNQYPCNPPGDLVFTPRFRNEHDKRMKYSRRALADRQQDLFTFNFNGRVGSFVIGRDSSVTLLPDSKLKIRFEFADMTASNIRTRISSFIIIDEYGIEYKFNVLNLAEVLTYINPISLYNNVIDRQTNITANIYRASTTGKYVVDKWFLSEIKNPRTGVKIEFTYENFISDFIGSYNMGCSFIQEHQYFPFGPFSRSFTINENRVKGMSKRIKEIILPNNSKYQFVYAGGQRMDAGTKTSPLTEIREYVENSFKKSFKLKYGYFYKKEILDFSSSNLYSLTQSQKRFLRLCLRSIQEVSSEETSIVPPTSFEYYTGSESTDPLELVPPFGSFSQDHWGYYTKINQDLTENEYPTAGNMNLLFYNRFQNGGTFYSFGQYLERAPTFNYAKLGILKSVINSKQGKLTFVYEQNRGKTGMSAKNSPDFALFYNPGVRVQKSITTDPANGSNEIITAYSYADEDGTSSGWGFESANESSYTVTKQMYHYKDDNTYSYSANSMSGKSQTNFQAYGYRDVMAKIDFASKSYSFYQAISATSKMTGPLLVADFVLFVGINLIQASNANQTFTLVSSGFYPTSMISPLPIMYSRVKVENVSANVNSGYTVHRFTSPATYNDQLPATTFPHSPKMRYIPWKYGLPQFTTYYTSQGVKVKEEENIYNQTTFEKDLTTNTNNLSCYLETNAIVDYLLHQSQGGGYQSYLSYSFYYPRTGRAEVSETKIRNYKTSGAFNETIIKYSYSPKNFQVNEVTTTKSDGEISGEKIYYPLDYEQDNIMLLCSTNNIINTPICKVGWKKESANSTEKKVVTVSLSELGTIANGDIKLVKVHKSELDQPIVSNIVDPDQVKNNLLNYTYLKEYKKFTYTEEGDILTVTDNGAVVSSTLYDYASGLPVVKVANGKFEDGIAYTSFEGTKNHEPAGINKWGFGTHLIKSSQGAITGNMAYDLVGTMWLNSLIPTKTYILSFWIKGPRPGVNINFPGGGNQIIDHQLKLVRSVNGWSLYAGEISGAVGIGIWRHGVDNSASVIDEVRVYPSDARMATFTYDPRFGVSSECDANNNIVYNQYDAAGRLIAVRDIEKNILKTYEYNYLKVGNDEMSKAFTKSCFPYQIGSEVLYTVYANAYFGFTKEEANNLALNDLNTNGPTYANTSTGTCTTVYARLELTYWNQSSSYGEADVAIRFYSDQYCTQPLYVTNHALTYTEYTDSYDTWGNPSYTQDVHDIIANGTEYVIGTNILMYDNGNYYGSFYRSYYIDSKPNYLIAY